MPTERQATNVVKVVEYASSADTERRATSVVKMVEYASSASSATWSAPAQLSTGDFISAATWNTYVVNNLLWLGTSHNHDGDAGDGASIAIPVPSGAIGIFDTSCPDGWTVVTAFNGRFLKGASSYGVTGGEVQHKHSQVLYSHDTGYVDEDSAMAVRDKSPPYRTVFGLGSGTSEAHPFLTGSTTTMAEPTNIQVVFCKKD